MPPCFLSSPVIGLENHTFGTLVVGRQLSSLPFVRVNEALAIHMVEDLN